jgi:hypothetical protein
MCKTICVVMCIIPHIPFDVSCPKRFNQVAERKENHVMSKPQASSCSLSIVVTCSGCFRVTRSPKVRETRKPRNHIAKGQRRQAAYSCRFELLSPRRNHCYLLSRRSFYPCEKHANTTTKITGLGSRIYSAKEDYILF